MSLTSEPIEFNALNSVIGETIPQNNDGRRASYTEGRARFIFI